VLPGYKRIRKIAHSFHIVSGNLAQDLAGR